MEANYGILEVKVGEMENNLSQATLQADGTYYYKIKRVDKAIVIVNLESDKSKAVINGSNVMPAKVDLPNDITQIPIVVVGEDNTREIKYLIIEKESNDTSIKEITGEGILSVDIGEDMAIVNVDEDLTSTDLTIKLTNINGYLKLTDDTEYQKAEITRGATMTGVTGGLSLQIKAEDGTEKTYIVSIYKKPNLNLLSVTVNSEDADYDEETKTYSKLVPNGNMPNIVITPEKLTQTVMLLTPDGRIIKQGPGTLTVTPTLSETLIDNYIIRIVSHNGEETGSKEYNLVIRQKSADTGILYVKVDGSGTVVNGTDYSGTVAGKNEYPVEIKLKDEKAKVKVLDDNGNVLIENQTGILNRKPCNRRRKY